MFVEVRIPAPSGPTLTLREADNFRDLKVVASGGDISDPRFVHAINQIGELTAEGYAWLTIDALRDLAGPRAKHPSWIASFAEMLEYAAQHGFLDLNLNRVRAHCEVAAA